MGSERLRVVPTHCHGLPRRTVAARVGRVAPACTTYPLSLHKGCIGALLVCIVHDDAATSRPIGTSPPDGSGGGTCGPGHAPWRRDAACGDPHPPRGFCGTHHPVRRSDGSGGQGGYPVAPCCDNGSEARSGRRDASPASPRRGPRPSAAMETGPRPLTSMSVDGPSRQLPFPLSHDNRLYSPQVRPIVIGGASMPPHASRSPGATGLGSCAAGRESDAAAAVHHDDRRCTW